MARPERWSTLLGLLAEDGKVSVEAASELLGVSATTLRRDLDQLAEQQMLTRTRGGAVANGTSYDLPLRYKTSRHASEKQRIGLATAALVQAGAIVGLNGGTTTTEVARAIATRADMYAISTGPSVTVVTNALNIANELVVRPHVKVVVTGGVIRPQSYELIGPLATLLPAQVSLDLAILGVDGIDVDGGATAHHEGEASINQLMVSRARQVIIVADASKLGVVAFARICHTDKVSTLVTDSSAEPGAVARLRDRGVTVVTA
ncbi:MAG: DeoR/GlpR family DNA-binding transcription regulator [Acidimicrobiales bacterium]